MLIIKNPYRLILLVTIVFLLIKNLVMASLLGDFTALPLILIHVLLIYLISVNHPYAVPVIYSWAFCYLILITGIKAGGKTLVILGGNGWEVNPLRYKIDIALFVIGLVILLFRKRMFIQT